MGQRGRKRRREAEGGKPSRTKAGREAPSKAGRPDPRSADFSASYRSRTEAKNAAARAALEPLADGERPRAVTVGAIVALLLGLVNLGFYLAGGEIGGERPALAGVLSYTGLMFAAAYGQWRARYWAVLGMEALLGIVIVIFALLGVFAENLLAVVVTLAVVVPAGALFWFLIKAMARIQMPVRR